MESASSSNGLPGMLGMLETRVHLSPSQPICVLEYLDFFTRDGTGKVMATRADCDALYQMVGLPRYDVRVPRARLELLADRADLSVSRRQQLMRCCTLGETCDTREYFDVSQYSTHPDVVSAMMSPETAHDLLLLWRPSRNRQRPWQLNLIRPMGWTHHKYLSDPTYECVPAREGDLCSILEQASCPMPEMIPGLLASPGSMLLRPIGGAHAGAGAELEPETIDGPGWWWG